MIKLKISVSFLLLLIGAFDLLSQSVPGAWDKAYECFNNKDFHGAIVHLEQLTRQVPGNGAAYYNMGIAKFNLGDPEGACSDLAKANRLGFKSDARVFDYYCDPEFKLKFLKKHFYKKEKLEAANNYRPLYTRKDSLQGGLRPERTCFDVSFYELEVKIIPRGKKIEGQNEIYFEVKEPTTRIQIDLFDRYRINGIYWKEQPLRYTREFNAVFIDFPEPLEPGEHHQIVFRYSGKPLKAPNPPWEGGFVWKKDSRGDYWAGVACEHLGASSWWPNNDYLGDEPDSMRITLEVPEECMAVSNGMLKNVREPVNGYQKYEWFVSYPINNYNVTYYMGNFEYFSDTVEIEGDKLLLKYYVLPENLEKARQHFQQTPEVLKFYSKVFGKYPFMRDGFGLIESPYEGMEHQTAIAYGHRYSNSGNNYEYRNGKYDYIIVHEAAHEWWGNSLTVSDMADMWIHEGFATYAEILFIESLFGTDEYLFEMNKRREIIHNFWPLVENYGVNENSFAGSDIYFKGATLLHNLRCTLNDDSLFFSIIKEYCVDNRYRIVTTQEFIDFVNLRTGRDLGPLFGKYLYDTGLPVLKYSFKTKNDSLILTYRWDGVEDGFFMPFAIRTDKDEPVRLEATTGEQTVSLEGVRWFGFYNEFQGAEGAPHNAHTYFKTRWESH